MRYFDAIIGNIVYQLVAFTDNSDYFSFPGFDFLYITNGLFVYTIGSCNSYYRHFCIDKCYRSMFHFGSRISLGMDIRNLFQFQCSFQSGRIVIATSQINEITGISKYLR